MTRDDINALSYTDFVGYINQWNVLPGSFETLNRWRVFGAVVKESSILEIACTTGFSSRELSIMSGAKAHGIDISSASVASAKKNATKYAQGQVLSYEVADGLTFDADQKYSHIIIGASLKFFPDPGRMIDRIVELLEDDGLLLASPFYITKDIPQKLIDDARAVFGITITTESYKDVMWMYKDFELLYQENKALVQETANELAHYCTSTIDLFREAHPELSEDVCKAAYERLLQIRVMSNELRPYQSYSVLVLRARKALFGKRLVELF